MPTTESAIALGILRIAAAQGNGVASFHRIRKDLPDFVDLTGDDWRESDTRPGEPMWHQICRNVQSHHDQDDNYIARGYLEHVPRVGYRITAAGRQRLNRN